MPPQQTRVRSAATLALALLLLGVARATPQAAASSSCAATATAKSPPLGRCLRFDPARHGCRPAYAPNWTAAYAGPEHDPLLRARLAVPGGPRRVPQVVDYRRAAGVVSPVKDQQMCGSCWAFSAAEALEGQLGLNGAPENVSAQQLVDCVKLDFGCNGGWMDDALAYATAPTPKSDVALREALVLFGPVSIALDATMAFQSYAGGVLTDDTCDPTTPDHALLLVGYNSVDGYWVVKNSWGPAWGRDGYVYMNSTIIDACGISSFAVVPYTRAPTAARRRERLRLHAEAVVAL